MDSAFKDSHMVMRTPAIWHPSPDCPRLGFAVVLFRRAVTLARASGPVTLWVSASQRFELFLDGKRVSRGPSRSDPWRWNVRRIRLPRLAPGRHVLAARVTHFGPHGGIGQLGGPGFFLVAGAARWTTGEAWRCWHDVSREGGHEAVWKQRGFTYDVGGGETVRGALTPWGWETTRFADDGWPTAKIVCQKSANPWGNLPLRHLLQPDPLPAMEERELRVPDFTRTRVPAQTTRRILLDMRELTNAYPVLTISGGRGARVRMVSAESPFTGAGFAKGNRDVTENKQIWGQCDEFLTEGGSRRVYTTLWFRSFRYLELTITTGDDPLVLEDVRALFTGYPLRQRARFSRYRRFWDLSWRTARLCAHETFFDCPHYEQAQFPGDSRVQAVFHYLIANDDRLARKAMDDFHASWMPDGLIACKWPSRANQILPTYALYWIGMMHDFRVYRGDMAFLRPYLPVAQGVMAWFARRVRGDGMLGYIEHAPFYDWTPAFTCGTAPQDSSGGSSILTLLYAEACRWMAGLEPESATDWLRQARRLTRATLRECWNARRELLADTAGQTSFSVHAQVQAVLAGAWPARQAQRVLARALDDATLTPPGTFYYRYYVMQALRATGLQVRFFAQLEPWERCLNGTGLTTWPETEGDSSRSDCHAWSVSPPIEFLQTVLGIEPDPSVNGFARALFCPTLGSLPKAQGVVPTPHGPIKVRLWRSSNGQLRSKVVSPVPVRRRRCTVCG